jgi:hypothetical protein
LDGLLGGIEMIAIDEFLFFHLIVCSIFGWFKTDPEIVRGEYYKKKGTEELNFEDVVNTMKGYEKTLLSGCGLYSKPRFFCRLRAAAAATIGSILDLKLLGITACVVICMHIIPPLPENYD